MVAFSIDRLGRDDAEAYRALRLEGLMRHPQAFGASHDDEAILSVEQFAGRVEDALIFGARSSVDLSLIGTMAIRIPTAEKLRHKALLWGVYVRPEARGLGVGAALLSHVLDHAATLVEEVTLVVGADNAPAFAMYCRAGFEQYGLEKRALKLGDSYVDERLMALDVTGRRS